MPHSVTTISPLRLSWAGGGSDLPAFYEAHGGAVVSTAIDQYIYVTVKRHSPLFGETYRLNYSESEHVQQLSEIRNDIARECLALLEHNAPLLIATQADLPAFSGLGSSSSFAVGLLHALHLMRGEHVSAGQLAEEACEVELQRLNRPMGLQDAWASAVGGLNHLSFRQDGRVIIDPLHTDNLRVLFDHMLLLWTGVSRKADDVLTEQKANIPDRIPHLKALAKLADDARDMLLSPTFDIRAFGSLLDSGWGRKRALASTVSTGDIDAAYAKAIDLGALGGKIAGAGSGGFLLLLAYPVDHKAIQQALGMQSVAIRPDARGSRVLSVT